jgi:hypothetical protein
MSITTNNSTRWSALVKPSGPNNNPSTRWSVLIKPAGTNNNPSTRWSALLLTGSGAKFNTGREGRVRVAPTRGSTVNGVLDLTDVQGSDKNFQFANQSGVVSLWTSGQGAPTSTPLKIGLGYIDLSGAPDIYISTGTSSSADWLIVN